MLRADHRSAHSSHGTAAARGGSDHPGSPPADLATDGQINGFLHFSSLVSGSNAYIVGSWEPPIAVLTADAPPPNTKFLYLVTQGELDQLIAQGWHVWYLPLMREFNYRVYRLRHRRARGARCAAAASGAPGK
jgi:hypothetical protein